MKFDQAMSHLMNSQEFCGIRCELWKNHSTKRLLVRSRIGGGGDGYLVVSRFLDPITNYILSCWSVLFPMGSELEADWEVLSSEEIDQYHTEKWGGSFPFEDAFNLQILLFNYNRPYSDLETTPENFMNIYNSFRSSPLSVEDFASLNLKSGR